MYDGNGRFLFQIRCPIEDEECRQRARDLAKGMRFALFVQDASGKTIRITHAAMFIDWRLYSGAGRPHLGRNRIQIWATAVWKGGKWVLEKGGRVLSDTEVDEIYKKYKSINKAIRSLEKQIAKHKKEISEYLADPDAHDNLGHLRNARNDAGRERIIRARVEKLEREIDMFEREIEKKRGNLGP